MMAVELFRWAFSRLPMNADRRRERFLRMIELEAGWRKSAKEWRELGGEDMTYSAEVELAELEAEKLAGERRMRWTRGGG